MRLSKHLPLIAWCAIAAFAGLPFYLNAQLADVPIKPGLWKAEVKTKAGTNDISSDTEYCFTAGTTLADYLTATYKPVSGTCKTSNKTQTGNGISYDTACTQGSMNSTGHIDFQLLDSEHFKGTSQTKVLGTHEGKPLSMEVDKIFSAKFVSAGCGDVKPVVVPSAHAK